MQNLRVYWQICVDRHGDWETIDAHETRAEAEAELRVLRASCPNAFLVRLTLTRVDRACSTPTLKAV